MDQRLEQSVPSARFALTVDVEEWFTGVADLPHQLDRFPSRLDIGMELCLELLAETRTPATFFFLGYLAELRPRWVERVVAAGHEVAVHGQYHVPLKELTVAQFRESVARARRALLDAGATSVVGFRAPVFSVDASTVWALDVLEELGFEYDSSIFPILNPRYGHPRAPRFPFRPTRGGRLTEFPISTLNVAGVRVPFSGGFYLRALPLWLLSAAFRRAARRSEATVCYFHPWELDVEQPALPGSRSARLRHRVGLATTRPKLEALLREFKFGTMSQVLRGYPAPTPAPTLLQLRRRPGPPGPNSDPQRT